MFFYCNRPVLIMREFFIKSIIRLFVFLTVVSSTSLFHLASAEDKLDFVANKYRIIEEGKSLSSQLKDSDTVYEIRFNFDLKGTKIVLPRNVVLKFEGGSIRNGVIEGEDIFIYSFSKCFVNISFSEKSSFRNDKACLSWWANNGEDCTTALEEMQTLRIPSLYLDLHTIYISHPIELSTRSRNIVGLEANPKSDWDLSGINKATTILPSNKFSTNGVSTLFHITAPQSEGSIKNVCFCGLYKVNYAIFQDCEFYSGEIANNRFNQFNLAAIVLNCSTEDVRIENNFITNCQCATWISTTPIDEYNLLHFDYKNAKGATNLVRYINNYVTYCCYGLICQIGTDLQCLRNTIAHTSCYAIYARVYGVANLDGNFFEGCGKSSFWINEKGLTGDFSGEKTCDFLLKAHKGEGNERVTGWGLNEDSVQIRPVIYIFGEATSSWDLKASIRNSWISNNNIRSLSSDNAILSSSTKGGIDCFACVGSGHYVFENNSAPLWKGRRPKFFICFSKQGQSNRTAITNGCKIIVNDLPKAFNDNTWFGSYNKLPKDVKISSPQ